MADPIGKIILRTLRRVFIWPLEASLVLLLFGLARLLPMPLAGACWRPVRPHRPLHPMAWRARGPFLCDA